MDGCYRTSDLTCHGRLAPKWAFMIEQNAVGGVHTVGFTVIYHDPISVKLRRRIGTARVEGRGFALRRFLHLPIKLRRGCLIEAGLLFQVKNTDRLQQAKGSDRISVRRIFGRLKPNSDMALR